MARAAVLAALAALLAAAPALAKGGPPFDRHTARAGQRISVGVSEVGAAWPERAVAVDVYLVPLAASPRWWPVYNAYGPAYGPPPALSGAIRLGRVWHIGWQTARLATRVPHVAPGRYVLAYWVAALRARWTDALPNYQVGPFAVLRVRR